MKNNEIQTRNISRNITSTYCILLFSKCTLESSLLVDPPSATFSYIPTNTFLFFSPLVYKIIWIAQFITCCKLSVKLRPRESVRFWLPANIDPHEFDKIKYSTFIPNLPPNIMGASVFH
jgi:hypothetical protein